MLVQTQFVNIVIDVGGGGGRTFGQSSDPIGFLLLPTGLYVVVIVSIARQVGILYLLTVCILWVRLLLWQLIAHPGVEKKDCCCNRTVYPDEAADTKCGILVL